MFNLCFPPPLLLISILSMFRRRFFSVRGGEAKPAVKTVKTQSEYLILHIHHTLIGGEIKNKSLTQKNVAM